MMGHDATLPSVLERSSECCSAQETLNELHWSASHYLLLCAIVKSRHSELVNTHLDKHLVRSFKSRLQRPHYS